MNSKFLPKKKRMGAWLLVGTMLGSMPAIAMAQDGEQASEEATPVASTAEQVAAAPAPVQVLIIRSIRVTGNQRLEAATVIAYSNLSPGQEYSVEILDGALRELYATELFQDVQILGAETGNLEIQVQENPVINRIILEGNKRIKNDDILPEIRLAPRQIFTRSKVRSDVERIIELYKRKGRFAATVEPKVVELDQNRVDLVFEIVEGQVSKIRAINIVGNEQYSDGRLRKEMFSREAGGLLGLFRGNDSYDPDRLAADQQKLRAFYLTEGYADFRVVSALAELTPDRRDFVITYVIEEGQRYKFGTVEVESYIRDLQPDTLEPFVTVSQGDWFNAQEIEDIVTSLNEIAGAQGYAFANIVPTYDRDAENLVMNLLFRVDQTSRVYVEDIEINGNTVTRDKVIRREFRLNEGDAFNAIKIRRSQDRIQSLGFFQQNIEIKQREGSAPDRVVLSIDVEEQSTGELQLSAGYSSVEQFIIAANIAQRNFLGKGQEVNAGVNWSRFSRSVNLGFTEPYLFDKNVLVGVDLFRRDLNAFSRRGDARQQTYEQLSTGLGLRIGVPLTEFISVAGRYSLINDKLSLDEDTFFSDLDGDPNTPVECNPILAGRYLCDELGTRLTSVIGYSIIFDNRDGLRATRGQRLVFSQDVAGLGGDVKYLRTRINAVKYFRLPRDFILSLGVEGGYIHPLQSSPGPGRDAIRLTDRFFGGQMRGFDIRGIGPRVERQRYGFDGVIDPNANVVTDALGGRAYYLGRAEVEIPVSAGIRSLGLRPSVFVDVGSVFSIERPILNDLVGTCIPRDGNPDPIQVLEPGDNLDCITDGANWTFFPGSRERFVGDSASPRLSVGIGVNWRSPFGPLRIDIAHAILKQDGDETRLFSFNVGTQF